MTVHQLPVEAGTFARYLRDLTALLDPGDGWYGIFCQRDPEGMRACLDGVEIPPWDVVESLLQDLATGRGAQFAEPETVRARRLHTASAAVHDRQPGGREALTERLELMRREQVYATGRAEELVRRLAGEPEGTPASEQLANELAWTRDDHARATARVGELRGRLAAVPDGPGADEETSVLPDSWYSRADTSAGPGPTRVPDGRTRSGVGWAADQEESAAPDGYAHAAPADGRPRWAQETAEGAGSAPVFGGPARPADGPGEPNGSGGPGRPHGQGRPNGPGRPHGQGGGAEHGREADDWSGFARRYERPTAAEARAAAADGWDALRERPGADPAYDAYPRPGSDATRRPGRPSLPDDWFRPEPAAAEPGDPAAPRPTAFGPTPPGPAASSGTRTGSARPEAQPDPPVGPPAQSETRSAKKRRPRGGARFAGVEGSGDEIAAVPVLPVTDDVPRGARYGGAAPSQETPAAPAVSDGARRAARETVDALSRLRAEGLSGEAHAMICEAAVRPASWLPLLAAELHRAGLDADWATLLWEAASQPALRLASAAGALAAAGRTEDSRQLLRQGVARPADDIAAAVLALEDESRNPEARALLTAYVQVHTAEDTARIAERDPRRLVPQLLDAARAQSAAHERDLVHALRVAGHLSG
ncbi:hypothetical protein OG735_33710 [Streptomyces sp. NBC_01210]|uniref:hypothetical protein n=1 Tax=Streptomyces sp. NBC_01210 TaxID=2903774 RepID=UPI002E101BD5|nr:hypothetical protein OG735_33710 [Streptomyces sp. NBC_01210]